MNIGIKTREAVITDLSDILSIYNEGIEDRIATLETELKDLSYMEDWFRQHTDRYKVIVAEDQGKVLGWASLNRYNNRCAYDGVADLSVYVKRGIRGKGIGKVLLQEIEILAKKSRFHKIVLFTFPFNDLGQGLYKRMGYREVGVFKEQGIMDGKYVDVMAMEKILTVSEGE